MLPIRPTSQAFPGIAEVYARFIALAALHPDLGGLLLFYRGLDADGIATVMAANVASLASLGVEPDAARARQALRSGICDFVVHSLDEALRILKNEVRQRRAASVVVTEAIETAIAEIAARGVQPDILAFAVPELIGRGAAMLRADAGDEHGSMQAVMWGVQREPMRWLPALDALAIGSLGSGDAARSSRRRWLEAAPRYLGRTFGGQRYVRMTAAEAHIFVAAVEAAVRADEIQVPVQVTQDGEVMRIES